jgi:uncharacterized membrane protein YeaQ/YmgE (transglycosylase-associated protein family)
LANLTDVLILAIIVLGMFAGWLANLVLGGGPRPDDWAEVLAAGLLGSFVGGLLFSLIAGDGLAIRPSGLLGSFLGAVIVLVAWRAIRSRR